MTQTARLIAYLRSHPGASGLEIIAALHLPKYTSRISDARAAGVQIECFRRGDGIRGYRVIEAPVQQVMMHATPGFPGFEHVAGTEPDRCFACRNPDESQPPKFSLQMQRQWP